MLHAASRATRIALGVSVITAVAFAPTIQAQKSGSSPELRARVRVDQPEGFEAGLRHLGHAAMAGDERSLLVHATRLATDAAFISSIL